MTERTFTKDEVLEMIDETLRLIKGGDNLPEIGSEQWNDYMEYSSGISYLKGSIKAQMYYKMGYEYDFNKKEWVK